jgi:UPF0755 protein
MPFATRVLSALLLATALAIVAGIWFWRQLHVAVALPAGGAIVSITPGEPFGSVCKHLEESGIVQHAWVLHWWGRWTGEDRLVRSGDYRFSTAISPIDVLQTLRSPGAALNRVTIPEGRTVAAVANLLERAGLGGADEFLCIAAEPAFLGALDLPASGLEGYLFPDTYDFAWTTAPDEILRLMVQRFREQTQPLQAKLTASGLTEAEMVTLASIIESETSSAEERRLISGVFHNRLRIGMRLQADPTAVYERGILVPTAEDLKIDSPYNTYIHTGLPPGPICNPGLASLEAAVEPAAVPYYYFVANNDGRHTFTRTLEEHNRAVAAARRASRRE